MLPNIDQVVYGKFKSVCRKAIFRKTPVENVQDIVQLGYLDVCRTMRGIRDDPKQSNSFKENALNLITELLNKPVSNQTEFDLLHNQCCEQCIACTGNVKIQYGQAQKLLNMSMKYLYNEYAFYKGRSNSLKFPSTNIEYYFHLPVDGQILNHLLRSCRFNKPGEMAWSKWTYAHYISFQNELRNRLINNHKPLEIDYLLWNERNQSIATAISGCA